MKAWKSIADIRREYGDLQLSESLLEANPLDQFKLWFEETSTSEKSDPTAMVLSTVDEEGLPDSRVVLLKGIEEDSFIFYTNYESSKGKQLANKAKAALNFYWPQMARQVRIRGKVKKVSSELSDAYFASRPLESQISAIASAQSIELPNRQILEEKYQKLIFEHHEKAVKRPPNWGGYAVLPDEVEFWQGRDSRLHDRFKYVKENEAWSIKRLAP